MHKDIAKWQQRNTDLEIKLKTHAEQIRSLEQIYNKQLVENAEFKGVT